MSIKLSESSSEGAAEKAELVSGILAGRKSESCCTWRRPHAVTRASCVEQLLCAQKLCPETAPSSGDTSEEEWNV